MFDWEKYSKEHLKKNNRAVLLSFLLWVVYTVGIALALAHVNSTLFLVIGLCAYLMSCFGWKNMTFWWQLKEDYLLEFKLLRECTEGFIREKKLEKEFEEYSGKRFDDYGINL